MKMPDTALEQERSKREVLISEIINRTLEKLVDWTPVKLMPGVGPQNPEVHQEFRKRLNSYVSDVRDTLSGMHSDELRRDYHVPIGSIHNPLTKRHGVHFKLCKELEDLRKCCPPWFGSGWSEKAHLLEAEYWCAAQSVSIGEAALMLVGVDPRTTNYDALFVDSYGKDERIDDVLYFLEDRLELLIKRFGDPKETPVSIELGDLIHWARSSGQKHPPQFNEMCALRLGAVEGSAGKDKEEKMHGSTKAFLARCLLTVAIDRYDLKKEKDASAVATAIRNYGDQLGFNLDAQSIAKIIRAGFDQLSDEVKDEISN